MPGIHQPLTHLLLLLVLLPLLVLVLLLLLLLQSRPQHHWRCSHR